MQLRVPNYQRKVELAEAYLHGFSSCCFSDIQTHVEIPIEMRWILSVYTVSGEAQHRFAQYYRRLSPTIYTSHDPQGACSEFINDSLSVTRQFAACRKGQNRRLESLASATAFVSTYLSSSTGRRMCCTKTREHLRSLSLERRPCENRPEFSQHYSRHIKSFFLFCFNNPSEKKKR